MRVPYAALLALAATVALAGCGAAEPVTPGGSGTTPVLTGSPSPTRSVTTPPPTGSTSSVETDSPTPTTTSSTPPTGGVVALGTAANGTTVRVHVGQQVLVTLDNTYWQFGAPTGALHAGGPQITKPAQPGTCLPGIGCGTVRLAATATSAGRGDITASRTTCGEAMACRPDQAHWVVHVVVA